MTTLYDLVIGSTTLGKVKQAMKGRKLFVWVTMFGNQGELIEVSKSKFLSAIGADVSFENDGLHDDTTINAKILKNAIYIG